MVICKQNASITSRLQKRKNRESEREASAVGERPHDSWNADVVFRSAVVVAAGMCQPSGPKFRRASARQVLRKVEKVIVTIASRPRLDALSHRAFLSDHPRDLSPSAHTHILPWIIHATRVPGSFSMILAVHSPWAYASPLHAHHKRVRELTILQAVGGAVWHGVKGVSISSAP
jgi:hypothetical protein